MKHINLFEKFVSGINYDQISQVTLERELGDLKKITPYILEWGDRVESDGEYFTIYDGNKLIKKDIPLNIFLTKYCGRNIKA